MERLLHDLRFAVRTLIKSPQHTTLATLTLALAIGVNTAIFSLVNLVLFVDLPMSDPDELAWVWTSNQEMGTDIVPVSLPDFQDFRDRNRSFASLSAFVQESMILTGTDQPERILVAKATANLLDVWGDRPQLGRGFVAGEDLPGASKVAILTSSMWKTTFGEDPAVLGRTVRLNDEEYEIVGVASERLEVGNLGRARLWIPLELTATDETRHLRQALVTGRLRPGVTLDEAREESGAIARTLAEEHPGTNRGWNLDVRSTDDSVMGDQARMILLMLVLTVGLVLLIACANVANLVLVRASARMRELAVRTALGASRMRLIRQLLTENVMIALAAGGLGIMLAHLLLRSLVSVTRGQEVLFTMATIDGRVLMFTLGVSLAAPLFFGLLPALGAVRGQTGGALRDGQRAGGGRRGGRTRNVLVVSQIALALSLMIVSGLLARSVIILRGVSPGYDTRGVLSMVVDLPGNRYEGEAVTRFFDELEDRAAQVPGVTGVALASSRPQPSISGVPFAIEGRDAGPDDLPTAYTEVVSNDYFDVMRIPLLGGRVFEERDDAETEPVAIVSREAAERFWPGDEVLGRRVRLATEPSARWRTIVGVVQNVAGGMDPANPDVPQLYVPHAQSPRRTMVVLARASGAPELVAEPLRREVLSIDPDQPVDDVRTMEAFVYDQRSVDYALVSMFMAFGLFAMAMAAMGIYGVMSFMVAQRRREIGLRLALGAERSTVLRLVLGQGGRLLVTGGAIGLALGFAMTRLVGGFVYGVSTTDPVTFVGVPAVLLVIALLANLLPASRATRIDPMVALRSE